LLDAGFGYWGIRRADEPDQTTSLIARLRVSEGPLQAVVWDTRSSAWRFSPGMAAHFLYEASNFQRSVSLDRPSAEDVARNHLGTELPSEEELRKICAEGLSRWDRENDPDGFLP